MEEDRICDGEEKEEMTDKTYTIFDIEKAWREYQKVRILRVLKGGKWTYNILKGKIPQLNGPTRAEIVTIDKEIGFPEYLDRYYNA